MANVMDGDRLFGVGEADVVQPLKAPAGVVKTFRAYDQHQSFLLPPSLDDWLPDDHTARFVPEIVVHPARDPSQPTQTRQPHPTRHLLTDPPAPPAARTPATGHQPATQLSHPKRREHQATTRHHTPLNQFRPTLLAR